MPSTLLFPCPFLVLVNAIFIFISCATNVKFWSQRAWTTETLVSSFLQVWICLYIHMIIHAIYILHFLHHWFIRKDFFLPITINLCETLDPRAWGPIDPGTFVCTNTCIHIMLHSKYCSIFLLLVLKKNLIYGLANFPLLTLPQGRSTSGKEGQVS